jgi:predicted transcriptional regulator
MDPNNQPLHIQSAGDFLNSVGEPPPALVEALIPDHSLVLLAGKPKHAKSLLALDIAEAVSCGIPVFGQYAVQRPGPVVYFGMEDGAYEIARRLRQRGVGGYDGRDLHICTDRFLLRGEEAVQKMALQLVNLQPVLVIIDTAAEAFRLSLRDRQEVIEAIAPLRHFCREHCSVLLVTHSRKSNGSGGDEIAGTNALAGAVDGWLSIHRKATLDNGDLALLVQREGRGGMHGEMLLTMDTQTLRFKVMEAEWVEQARQAASEQKQRDVQGERFRTVAQAIEKCGGTATVTHIEEQCSFSYKTVQNLVREMREQGLLEDSGLREGPKRNIIAYRLTGRMQEWLAEDTGKRQAEDETDYGPTARLFLDWEAARDDDEEDEK